MDMCQVCNMMPCVCGTKTTELSEPNASGFVNIEGTKRPTALLGSSLLTPDTTLPPPEKSPEDEIVYFGKHKGKPLAQILIDEASYLDWMNGEDWIREPLKTAVRLMNAKYAPQIEEAIEQKNREFWRSKRLEREGSRRRDR